MLQQRTIDSYKPFKFVTAVGRALKRCSVVSRLAPQRKAELALIRDIPVKLCWPHMQMCGSNWDTGFILSEGGSRPIRPPYPLSSMGIAFEADCTPHTNHNTADPTPLRALSPCHPFPPPPPPPRGPPPPPQTSLGQGKAKKRAGPLNNTPTQRTKGKTAFPPPP